MAEQTSGTEDRSTGDRRGQDRRRTDRRNPPPVWRRPWALVAYGAIVMLVLVLLFRPRGDAKDDVAPLEKGGLITAPAAPAAASVTAPTAQVPPNPTSNAAFEALILQGRNASGLRLRTELSCNTPSPIALSKVDTVPAAISALRMLDGRVPAAECKWGQQGETQRPDFLLLVPPRLAEQFASTPLASDEFVPRRHLIAEVEWIGRSDALALRPTGVLRQVFNTGAAR